MKTINLLPAWYLLQRRNQRRFHVHLGIMLLLGAAMIGAVMLGENHVRALAHQRDALFTQLEGIDDPSPELLRCQTQLKKLEDLRLARRELGNTVPMSAVLQQIRNQMADGMALSGVTIEVRAEPVKGSGLVGDTRNPPRYRDVAHVAVVGIAPDHRPITRLVELLSQNPLFAEVALDYSRTGTLRGYAICKFEIRLSMNMEPLTSQAPLVASALPAAPGGDTHEQ